MAGLIPFNKRGRNLGRVGNDHFSNMIDNFFHDSFPPMRNPMMDPFKVDVKELDNEYVVEAELPEVKKDEIDLSLNDGRLSITVNREENVEEKGHEDTYIHKERRTSSMQRSIFLEDAKPDGVKAKLEDGLLKVTVEKEQQTENNNRIEIE